MNSHNTPPKSSPTGQSIDDWIADLKAEAQRKDKELADIQAKIAALTSRMISRHSGDPVMQGLVQDAVRRQTETLNNLLDQV